MRLVKEIEAGRGLRDHRSEKGIDELNGLQAKSYEDVAARFWNLIYKDNYHGGKKPRAESPSKA